jgi:tetratricopeptide (TPR) repeat protein
MIQSGVHFHKWDEAIESWKSVLGAAPHKEAGYLAYNIAIGYEVLGAYDEAVKWAQNAYTEYGNNLAQSCVAMLRARKRSEQRVDEQMGGGEE